MWNPQLEINNSLPQEEIIRNKLIEREGVKAKNYIIKQVSQDIYAVSSDKINTTSFFDPKWESIFSVRRLREQDGPIKSIIKMWSLNAGFWEVKEWDRYNLYKRSDIDIKTLKSLSWAKPIDQYSEEYYKAWQDIKFCMNRLYIERTRQFDGIPGYYHEFIDIDDRFNEIWTKEFYNLLNIWVIKLEDLDFYVTEKSMKNRQITPKMYEEAIKIMQQILPKQCAETRFKSIEIWDDGKVYEYDDSITLEDLGEYLKRWMIDEKMFQFCKWIIEKRDELTKSKEVEKWVIKKTTGELLKEQKERQEKIRKMILEKIK